MDYRFLLTGIKNILFNPLKYWQTIHSENITLKVIRNSFLLPLIILVSVAVITGSVIFINTELSFTYSIFLGIRRFLVLLTTTCISAMILKEITYPLTWGEISIYRSGSLHFHLRHSFCVRLLVPCSNHFFS